MPLSTTTRRENRRKRIALDNKEDKDNSSNSSIDMDIDIDDKYIQPIYIYTRIRQLRFRLGTN